MPHSLLSKLLGAFALVILVLAVVVSLLAGRATAGQFRLYTNRSGELWAEQLAPLLAQYYASAGSWDGVETAIQSPMGPGMGMGMMRSQNAPGTAGRDMWAMMGQRLIVADHLGRVAFDSAHDLAGETLPPREMAGGAPILIGGQQVGTVFVAADVAGAASPAAEFLASVNRSILMAVLIAGLMALALGALLFFQLMAPVRQLTVAAHAIAAGDLGRRVHIRSRDELGELAAAFNAMATNLADAEEKRRHLVADVAHELRTPLSVLQANLEAMQDGILPLDAEQVASLQEETLLLSRLVADLRLLSLVDAGQLKLQRSETDLGELIRKGVDRMRPEAQAKGVDLQLNALEGAALLSVDPDRINQVLANLLGNALRYASVGGMVTVEARMTDDSRAALGAATPSFVVSVSDSGPGISSEDLAHVFDRFYRADKSRNRASGGSGLGLAIVRYLVEAHGGNVWVDSPISQAADGTGYGTRVTFALPVASSANTRPLLSPRF